MECVPRTRRLWVRGTLDGTGRETDTHTRSLASRSRNEEMFRQKIGGADEINILSVSTCSSRKARKLALPSYVHRTGRPGCRSEDAQAVSTSQPVKSASNLRPSALRSMHTCQASCTAARAMAAIAKPCKVQRSKWPRRASRSCVQHASMAASSNITVRTTRTRWGLDGKQFKSNQRQACRSRNLKTEFMLESATGSVGRVCRA